MSKSLAARMAFIVAGNADTYAFRLQDKGRPRADHEKEFRLFLFENYTPSELEEYVCAAEALVADARQSELVERRIRHECLRERTVHREHLAHVNENIRRDRIKQVRIGRVLRWAKESLADTMESHSDSEQNTSE